MMRRVAARPTALLMALHGVRAISGLTPAQQEAFTRNKQVTEELAGVIETLRQSVTKGGGEKARTLHTSRGKLLARDRIKHLIDDPEEFIELSPLAGYQCYPERPKKGEEGPAFEWVPGAGIVTGVGKVFGRHCMIVANDSTVKGGVYYPDTGKKHLRAQKIAEVNHLPTIYLVDSGGGNLAYQAGGFADEQGFGRVFFNQATMSAKGINQIAVVMGSCTAGGAYIPCMADETVMVKGVGTIFLGGPQLVFAATGEVSTPEELGGADLHCKKSGVADHYALDDKDALERARRIVLNLDHPDTYRTRTAAAADRCRAPCEELRGLVPPRVALTSPDVPPAQCIDVREVIVRITDGGTFDEFKAEFGKSLVCGFATIGGNHVGIIANNNVEAFSLGDAALKGSHFVQLCNQRGIALVFLQDTPTASAMPPGAESPADAKQGSKLLVAIGAAKVPKIAVIMGGSYGTMNFAMCGRSMDPAFLFLWPGADLGMIPGADQETVPNAQQLLHRSKRACLYNSARVHDDGVIDPANTRSVLMDALDATSYAPRVKGSHLGLFRM